MNNEDKIIRILKRATYETVSQLCFDALISGNFEMIPDILEDNGWTSDEYISAYLHH